MYVVFCLPLDTLTKHIGRVLTSLWQRNEVPKTSEILSDATYGQTAMMRSVMLCHFIHSCNRRHPYSPFSIFVSSLINPLD